MNETLQCPVDQVLVNENKARIIAFFVLVVVLVFLLTINFYLILFLLPDFLLRATTLGKYSYLGFFANIVVSLFKVRNKPADRAPKRFAAGTGFVFTVLILSAVLLSWGVVAVLLSVTLAFFAFLELVFGFCAGCFVYSMLQKIF